MTDARRIVGDPGVARAAIQALRQWHFNPFIVDGKAVAVVSDIPVHSREGAVLMFDTAQQ